MCEPKVGKWGGSGVSVQGLVPSLSATLFLYERRGMMGGGRNTSTLPLKEGSCCLGSLGQSCPLPASFGVRKYSVN